MDTLLCSEGIFSVEDAGVDPTAAILRVDVLLNHVLGLNDSIDVALLNSPLNVAGSTSYWLSLFLSSYLAGPHDGNGAILSFIS